LEGVEWYPVNRCYWNYLRVYKQGGVEMVGASPHAIPAEWTLLERDVPARVDELDEEMHGGRGYGTLVVVPGGGTVNTGFEFALPASVVSQTAVADEYIYRLHVQKQPGTLANKLTVRVHLPARARLGSVSMEAVLQGEHILVETDLRTDLALEIVFKLP
jgi:hypothetical protein